MIFLRNSYYCDFSPIPPSVHCKGSFIWSLSWLVFTVLALNYLCLVWVSLLTTYWSSVVQPPPLTCAGCATPFCQTKKTILFVCLLAVAFLPVTMCVLFLFISHDMHLVVSTHPYFFWVVCYPSRTFHPKEPEQKPQNKFFPSPHRQTMSFLTSDPWPATSYIGWVQVGDAWVLRVLHIFRLLLMHLLWSGDWSVRSTVHFWFLMAWVIFRSAVLYDLLLFGGWALSDHGPPFPRPTLYSLSGLVSISCHTTLLFLL